MRLWISALPLAGCAVMSVLCRRRGRHGRCGPVAGDEVAALRTEIAALRAGSPVAQEASR